MPFNSFTYPTIKGPYTNLLLVDSLVPNYEEIINSVNSVTFPIVYHLNFNELNSTKSIQSNNTNTSDKNKLIEILKQNFTSFSRIGICFTSSSYNPKIFLDCQLLFFNDETVPYSDNLSFMINIINEFNVKNIDFLACNTLNYPNWVNYYNILTEQTGVIVGASNNKTGNIQYGGDWVMENGNQDIEFIYFTNNINYYTYLLDYNTSYVSGLISPNNMTYTSGYLYATNNNNIAQINLTNSQVILNWVTLSSSPLVIIFGITTDDTYLYITYSDTDDIILANYVSRINISTKAIDYEWVEILNNSPFPITGRGLYFNSYNSYLYLLYNGFYFNNTPNNTICEIYELSGTYISDIQIIGQSQLFCYDSINNYIYFQSEPLPDSSIYSIIRADLLTNDTITWFNFTNYTNPLNLSMKNLINSVNARGICVDTTGTYLYLFDIVNSMIIKFNLSNQIIEGLLFNYATQCRGLLIVGDYLYASSYDVGTISKISLDTFKNDGMSWYSIQISLPAPDNTVIFNGYLSVDNKTNLVTGFYDKTNKNVNIYINDGLFNEKSGFITVPSYSFTNGGINITSFPNLGSGNYQLYGNNKIYSFTTTNTTTVTMTFTSMSDPFTCFLEDTKILTIKGYKLVQDLRKGDLIKTSKNGFVPLDMIGKKEIYHPAYSYRNKDQLYICSQSKYSELFNDLIITGMHSILVDQFINNERDQVINIMGDIFVTDNKYRLPACIDNRTKPYDKAGIYNIYHIALENDNYYYNYGIYANGLLVETCSQIYLKELSNMELI